MREPGSPQARQAAELLVRNAAPAVDPLAPLRGALDRLCPQCTEKLGQLAPVPIDLALLDLVSGTTGDAVPDYGASAVVGAFYTPNRSSRIVIGADGALMNAALEAVFGADGSEPADDAGRAPTRIVIRLAGTIFEHVADALRLAFFGVNAAPLELEKVEAAAKWPAPARRDEPSVLAKFGLSTLERAGEMFILLPQSALQEIELAPGDGLAVAPMVRDTGWSKRIEQEVQRTQVMLHAVLDERELTLGEIAELRVGQVLPLKATPRSSVKVVCNDQTLFWCELGQTEGIYTLRIKDFPDEEQELINAITAQ